MNACMQSSVPALQTTVLPQNPPHPLRWQSIVGAMWGIAVHLRAADRPCLASPGLLHLLQRCHSLTYKPRKGSSHQITSIVAMVRRAALGMLGALDYDQVCSSATRVGRPMQLGRVEAKPPKPPKPPPRQLARRRDARRPLVTRLALLAGRERWRGDAFRGP